MLKLYKEANPGIIIVPDTASDFLSQRVPESVFASLDFQKKLTDIRKLKEESFECFAKDKILICDGGIADAAADLSEKEFKKLGGANLACLYDAVIFVESAANISTEFFNYVSINSRYMFSESILREQKLLEVWSQNPNFYLVKADENFLHKYDQFSRTVNTIIFERRFFYEQLA